MVHVVFICRLHSGKTKNKASFRPRHLFHCHDPEERPQPETNKVPFGSHICNVMGNG
jgi:hypothetical protein